MSVIGTYVGLDIFVLKGAYEMNVQTSVVDRHT